MIVFGVGGVFSRIWTNYLWYQEVGYTTVFWTPIVARLAVGVFFAVVFFIIFYGSLWLARKISPRLLPVRGAEDGEVFELAARRRWPGRLMLIVSIVIAIVIGVIYSGRWEQVLLFLNQGDFGYTDPLFGKDAAFFVFTLPVWKTLVNFVGVALLFTFIATSFTYVVDRAMVLNDKQQGAPGPSRQGPSVGDPGPGHGGQGRGLHDPDRGRSTTPSGEWSSGPATPTSTPHCRCFTSWPSCRSSRQPSSWPTSATEAGGSRPWRSSSCSSPGPSPAKPIPPSFSNTASLPTRSSAETPYIANNIEATRWAFGLDKITNVPLAATNDLTAADIRANSGTIDNVRLWEPRPALSTYSQIQEIRLYYAFKDVDVDRYTIDGKYRQVLVSARELDQTQLQKQSQTWVNQHLTYTHGYGAVVSPVNEAGGDGLPILMVRDIPPRTDTDLKITRPEIYYGELGNQFVVVKTTSPEFDYPKGDTNVSATYQGQGGIAIGNKIRQAAFSFRFRTLKLFVSSSLTADSRVMFRRTIKERVQALAPFLTYDKDPYLVIRDDGSLVWMWDAYTTSGRFPYSQPRADGNNYMRNPIKVVINAYDGRVTFYQIDGADPLANAWGKVFKGLFTPGDQMPADLRAHMRYPEDLYSVQADVLTIYHMKDPQIFYNKEDVWEIPTEIYGAEEIPVVPYYEVLALPGETAPEFALLQPFAPLTKKNLASLMVARQDGEHYGELLVIDFPKDKLVFGPSQVEARISNDPIISSQLTLWNQSGSQVIRGNLLVVPINQSVMYFEPLYLQAQQSPIPELTRVIVSYGDQVVMEPTLSDALTKIFGERDRHGVDHYDHAGQHHHHGAERDDDHDGAERDDHHHRTGKHDHHADERSGGADRAGQSALSGGHRGAEARRLGRVRPADRGVGKSAGGAGRPE